MILEQLTIFDFTLLLIVLLSIFFKYSKLKIKHISKKIEKAVLLIKNPVEELT